MAGGFFLLLVACSRLDLEIDPVRLGRLGAVFGAVQSSRAAGR
jgi:hypothetical protein